MIMIGSSKTYRRVNQARTLLEAGRLADAVELADILFLIAPAKNEVNELLVGIALHQSNGSRAIELLG